MNIIFLHSVQLNTKFKAQLITFDCLQIDTQERPDKLMNGIHLQQVGHCYNSCIIIDHQKLKIELHCKSIDQIKSFCFLLLKTL